jgi:flagellar basal body-associated protein FliL
MGETTSLNITETVQDGSVPWMIIIACLVIALLGLLIGMMWLRARKARRGHGHLDAAIARPESLADEHGPGGRHP